MTAVNNFLQFIIDNWTSISVCLVLIFGIYAKAKKFYEDWQKKTEAEKQAEFERAVNEARNALRNIILNYVARAEVDWQEHGLGEIKRADVISTIFSQYPVLTSVADQDELIAYIDELINEALKTVREKIRSKE